MPDGRYLFYARNSVRDAPQLSAGYRWTLWKPSVGELTPSQVGIAPFAVWWLFHMCHVFANRDYALFLIHHGESLVHRSVVTPRYFRFPFMAEDDLQIGDTWTEDRHRGQGLATFALRQIPLVTSKRRDRRFWYVVEEQNIPSIRVVEKAGFRLEGRGKRIPRFGVSALGAYVMDERSE